MTRMGEDTMKTPTETRTSAPTSPPGGAGRAVEAGTGAAVRAQSPPAR